MTRNQFLIVTTMSGLVALLLILQILFARMVATDQVRVNQAQQALNQGQTCANNLVKLAQRINQVSQQSQDQGLKDLLNRQQIQFGTPPAQNADSNTSAPAAQPASTAPTTH